jgi:uncharacterized protein YyaL (SSP411 family)
MPNRLAQESSPYLLQHANNPVDWYPWGEEALERSRAEDKPIFLSIGYSACHWCHVMEHESFESETIAAQLNENFVCIKVDREERPELDQIYMTAVQLMTGRGGWPMSMFLTPDQKPFYGGTYWPPTAKMGMPGFDQVLAAVLDAWTNRRDQAIEQSEKLTLGINDYIGKSPQSETLVAGPDVLLAAATKLERTFDFTHGGFGQAPKFPHPTSLQVLLRVWHRTGRTGLLDMVKLNLDKMAAGGIYDHLAGGFARYSVDERWLVPHFEKMLYDNAQLTSIYVDGYCATGDPRYAQTVRETCDYILNYMTDELGGFHSTEDADSEGVEGKFYVWTPEEVADILGTELAERFCYVYDVAAGGNFEGQSILNLPKTIEQCAAIKGWDLESLQTELTASKAKLLAVRDQRIRPGKDDKILASWNGLMIEALAKAAGALDEPRYLQAASAAAQFLLDHMRTEDGRLYHTWRHGTAKQCGFLDDYACVIDGLVSLYQVSGVESWIDEAYSCIEIVDRHFKDEAGGAYFFAPDDHETLITRHKDLHDSAVPSGNAKLATALMRMGKLCGRANLVSTARDIVESNLGLIEQSPQAAGQMMIALDMDLGPFKEIAIVGEGDSLQSVLQSLHSKYIPNYVVAHRASAESDEGSTRLNPLFIGRQPNPDAAAIYICEKFSCSAPIHASEASAKFKELANAGTDT